METKLKRPVEDGGRGRNGGGQRDFKRERTVTHENGHDYPKCTSVIKKLWFIFNGQPDSDL